MQSTQTRIICGVLVAILLLFAGSTIATAHTSSVYTISWWTIDSGGGTSLYADDQYTLNGTIGQPDVGTASGVGYAIKGGFWGSLSAIIQDFFIYLPLILTN